MNAYEVRQRREGTSLMVRQPFLREWQAKQIRRRQVREMTLMAARMVLWLAAGVVLIILMHMAGLR